MFLISGCIPEHPAMIAFTQTAQREISGVEVVDTCR
jgi:hypothetical protein